MNFFNNKICTKPVSLSEAAASVKETKKARSLDELLAEAAKGPAQVKTASAEKAVVSASAEAPVAAPVVAESKVEVKTAGFEDFIKEKKEEKKDDDDVVEVKDEDKKDDKKDDKPFFAKKEDKKDDKEGCVASKKITLKMAKSVDFRNWTAEDVVKSWKQHGTIEACKKNVEKFVSDPCVYCGLLQVAGNEAATTLKTAAAAKTEKKAEKVEKSRFTKIAKLSKEDKELLSKYYVQIYGKEYVDSLLEDY